MSNEDQDGNGENVEGLDGEGGKKGGKKKLLLIIVPLVLLIGGGAGAYFTGMLDSLLGKDAASAEGEHAEEGDHAKAEDGHGEKKADDGHGKKAEGGGHGEGGEGSGAFLEIPTMIVNLAGDEEETPRYLRLTVQLELADPSERADVESVIPRVIDQFQTYLRELRVRDLRGSAGIYRLQMELLWRVNQAAAPAEIKDVLFQEILIQ